MKKIWLVLPVALLMAGCPATPTPVTVSLDKEACTYPPNYQVSSVPATPVTNTVTKERVEKDYTKIIERETITPAEPIFTILPYPTPTLSVVPSVEPSLGIFPSPKPTKKPHPPKPSKKPTHGIVGFNGNPLR